MNMIWKRIKYFFKKSPSITRFVSLGIEDATYTTWTAPEGEELKPPKDLRKMREPKDVMHELETSVSISLADIDILLKKMKARKLFVEKELKIQPNNEMRVIEILEARKKYPKVAHLFKWKTTVDSKIKMLTACYMLKHREIGRYIKDIPEMAISVMEDYTDLYKKVNKKGTPEFSIIAPDSHFKSDDPILLAKSPFGEYYYILCAWDKEINLVNELLDGEKLILEEDKE